MQALQSISCARHVRGENAFSDLRLSNICMRHAAPPPKMSPRGQTILYLHLVLLHNAPLKGNANKQQTLSFACSHVCN